MDYHVFSSQHCSVTESLPHALSVQSVVLNTGVKYTTTTCFLTLPCSLYHTNYLHEILPRDPVTPVANVTMHVLGQSQQSWQCWVSPQSWPGELFVSIPGLAGDTGYHRHPHPHPGSVKEAGAFLNISQHFFCAFSVFKHFFEILIIVGISYF